MADRPRNRIPWTEIAGCVPMPDTERIAGAAQRFFQDKHFAAANTHARRSLITRLLDTAFAGGLPFFEVAQQLIEEIRESSDAKAMACCVSKIEQLRVEGWQEKLDRTNLRLKSIDLEIQLNPNSFLKNDQGEILLLYAYFRKKPLLQTDAIRALLHLLNDPSIKIDNGNIRVVILDCYKDICYEGSDFQGHERWIVNQVVKILSAYNTVYRAHLNGDPPPTTGGRADRYRRPSAGTSRVQFAISPDAGQLCLGFV
jgi:hypothetical protein